MATSGWIALAVAVAATIACGVKADAPPEIVVDRTACSHCGMLVSEPVFAAAYRIEGSEARVFDDVGCLVDAVRREPRRDAIRFWFHDVADGSWIDGTAAVFVKSTSLRTPMAGGIVAYRDGNAAARGAAAVQARVVGTLEALLASGTEGGGR
jgi:copper chaperone NosL